MCVDELVIPPKPLMVGAEVKKNSILNALWEAYFCLFKQFLFLSILRLLHLVST